jgi:hypothetical protein
MNDDSSINRTGFFIGRAERKRTGALSAILLLLVCCAAGFYIHMDVTRAIRAIESDSLSDTVGPDLESVSEAGELRKTGDELESISQAASAVTQAALLAEISGRNPIAQPAELARQSTGSEAVLEEAPWLELEPPQVTIVAVMISGQDKIAMVNVLGEDTGLVVRQGTKFSGGEAMVTRIDESGVTFTWMKKSYTVVM